MLNVYEQIDRNKQKSLLVMVFFTIFVVLIAWLFTQVAEYDLGLVGLALIFSGVISFSSYWWSDKIILSISRAKPASRKGNFNFFTVTENLAMASQIPMPQLYVIEDTAPNAFATGRDPEHAVVCATTGLLAKLSRTELEGVIAHELSHVKNYDIRLMSLVTVLVGMISLLGDWFLRGMGLRRKQDKNSQLGAIVFAIGLVLILLSPLIARLIRLAISRRREFFADASAAMLTRYPEGLATALEKISADQEPLEVANKATAHLYIANPLKNRHDSIGWFANLFNTHPPVNQRIEALRQMR